MKYHKHLLYSCVDALNAIFFENRHADKCIEYYLRNNKKWGSRDRRFFAETVYDCVRWWRLYWTLLDREQQTVDLSFLAPSLWRRDLPLPELPEFDGFSPEHFKTAYSSIKNPAVRNSMPDWLYERLVSELGDDAKDYAAALNVTNSLVIRVNQSKTAKIEVIKSLAQEDVIAEPLLGTSSGLLIRKRSNIFKTKAFKQGWIEVQDGSSQQVADFLQVEPGMRVIDACAGAGGKTLHIADLLNNKGKIISMDIHQWKLDQLKLRARRDNFNNIELKVIDSSKAIKRLKDNADRLLLDVPCSGLGVLRRNPDSKWKVSAQSIEELQQLQRDLLSRYSSMLKPGGLMLYATCSILPSENQAQIEWFLREDSNFTLVRQRSIFPVRTGYDGFFMALLRKSQ